MSEERRRGGEMLKIEAGSAASELDNKQVELTCWLALVPARAGASYFINEPFSDAPEAKDEET